MAQTRVTPDTRSIAMSILRHVAKMLANSASKHQLENTYGRGIRSNRKLEYSWMQQARVSKERVQEKLCPAMRQLCLHVAELSG